MNVVAEYIFKIQSIGYRPPMERMAYYLLPVIPVIIFFTSIVLAYKGQKIRKFLYAFGFVAPLLAVVFFLKIQLPGHRTEYWGWEGIRVWGDRTVSGNCSRNVRLGSCGCSDGFGWTSYWEGYQKARH